MYIGLAVDNTIPIHLPAVVEFIRRNCKTLRCDVIDINFRLRNDSVIYEQEIAALSKNDLEKCAKFDFPILVTALPFANNYFYEGDRIFILSFSEWHTLTPLPMTNGLIFMICQIVVKYFLNIGENHDESTGCINDFMWDKSIIDAAMRAAFVCSRCKNKSEKNERLTSAEFSDVESLLGVISNASRRGVDILAEQAVDSNPILKDGRREATSVFLCHNSHDKASVRELNELLKGAGIRTWLDEEKISPGQIWQDVLESEISTIAACLIVVGDSGTGPWQDMERRAFINEFATRGCKIIPVLIGRPSSTPALPLFLRQFMWADLRSNDARQVARLIGSLKQ